jgi:hypothetical protein
MMNKQMKNIIKNVFKVFWMMVLIGYASLLVYGVHVLGIKIMTPWFNLGAGLISATFALLTYEAKSQIELIDAQNKIYY